LQFPHAEWLGTSGTNGGILLEIKCLQGIIKAKYRKCVVSAKSSFTAGVEFCEAFI
jgi:hypothetical protein